MYNYNYQTMPNYRRLIVPLVIFGLLASWLLSNPKLGVVLLDVFLPEEQYGPLDLPAELVIERFPPPVDWYADPEHDALLLVSVRDEDGSPRQVMERLIPPWKEHETLPNPDDDSRVGSFSFDRRFRAKIVFKVDERALNIVSSETKEVLARVDPFAAPAASKFLAWHPRANVLVMGGDGHVSLLREPEWQPKKLATAARDYEEWACRVQSGEEETGYSPNENVSQVIFSDDGQLLICAMDRGIRVYSWDLVLQAEANLPLPKFSVDNELVTVGLLYTMKMTFATQYDAARKRILWAGLEGTLSYLDLETQSRGTLLSLPKGYVIRKMHFLDRGQVLACEIYRLGRSTWSPQGLFLLDYPRLTQAEEKHLQKPAPTDHAQP